MYPSTTISLLHVNAEVLLDEVICKRRLTLAKLMLDSPHSARLLTPIGATDSDLLVATGVDLRLFRQEPMHEEYGHRQ